MALYERVTGIVEADNTLENRNRAWVDARRGSARGAAVLIVDDSEADVYFLLRAIAAADVENPIYVVRSGEEAFAYLKGEGKYANRDRYPFPKIVILDLRMAPTSGLDVLRWKRNNPACKQTLFVALSNFDSPSAINEAYAAGANTFLSKPLNGQDVKNIVEGFQTYWELRKSGKANENPPK